MRAAPLTASEGELVTTDDIRALGWSVAVHNDYRLDGIRNTFWLFTKDGRAVKGEGNTDADALNQVRDAIAAALVADAAASELLSALKTMVELVQERGMPARWETALASARRAIAKAEAEAEGS